MEELWCGAGSVSGYSQVKLETRPINICDKKEPGEVRGCAMFTGEEHRHVDIFADFGA